MKLRLFEWMANEPSAWFGSADTLLKSASLIWPERERIPRGVWVALMLRGYAIENLLKGLRLQAGNSLSSDGKVQRVPSVANHNLLALYEKLGHRPAPPRRDMLRSLTTAVLHLGRYPVPMRYERFPVHREDEPDPTALWCPEYEAEFWLLVRELGSSFEFMKKLPPDYLEGLEARTWRPL